MLEHGLGRLHATHPEPYFDRQSFASHSTCCNGWERFECSSPLDPRSRTHLPFLAQVDLRALTHLQSKAKMDPRTARNSRKLRMMMFKFLSRSLDTIFIVGSRIVSIVTSFGCSSESILNAMEGAFKDSVCCCIVLARNFWVAYVSWRVKVEVLSKDF